MIKKIKHAVTKYRDKYLGKDIIKKHAHAAPDFLIIGTQKGGTTSLFQYLGQHPDIIPPTEKELAYFAWNHHKGLRWYLNNFPKKSSKGNKLTFEATPAYIYLKTAPKQIAALFPEMKFILLLRDPVERAYSHWQFYHDSKFINEHKNLTKDERPFETALKDELANKTERGFFKYIDRGKYGAQLSTWYQYFKPEQILILESRDLKLSPRATLREVTDFLGIADYYANHSFKGETVEGLSGTVEEAKSNNLKEYNVNRYSETMQKETEATLRALFQKDGVSLEQLTGKKFSWMNKTD